MIGGAQQSQRTVPRKTKNESEVVETRAADPLSTAAPAGSASRNRAKVAQKSSSKSAQGKAVPSAKKKTTAKRTRAASKVSTEPSDADIRLRAYFIAERRVQMALQGDPSKDWIEAKQQLLAEAQQTRS